MNQKDRERPSVENGRKRSSGQTGLIKESIFSDQAAELPIENLININTETRNMLDMIQTLDFDIFSIRNSTKENELITVITYIMHKHRLF